MSVMTLGLVQAVLRLPPHPYWCTPGNPFGFTQSDQYQAAFYCVFGLSHLILFSSLLAYLAAQLVDVLLFDLIKRATKGRFLYLRNNLSTWAAQLIDTLIVNSLVFFIGMNIPVKMGFEIMGSCYLFKVVIACLETPLLYAAVRSLKKYLRHAA